jgi:hypothetical protein
MRPSSARRGEQAVAAVARRLVSWRP